MTHPMLRTLFGAVELQPVESTSGAYLLPPELDELLGVPGFGLADPICLPGAPRPFDLRTMFAACRKPVLH
jgi:hypothetical protein